MNGVQGEGRAKKITLTSFELNLLLHTKLNIKIEIWFSKVKEVTCQTSILSFFMSDIGVSCFGTKIFVDRGDIQRGREKGRPGESFNQTIDRCRTSLHSQAWDGEFQRDGMGFKNELGVLQLIFYDDLWKKETATRSKRHFAYAVT